MRLFALLVNKICYASFLELSCLCTHNIFFLWVNECLTSFENLFLLLLFFACSIFRPSLFFSNQYLCTEIHRRSGICLSSVVQRLCSLPLLLFFVVFLFSSFINVVVVIVFYCEIHNLKSKIFMMAYQDTYMNESHSFHSYEIAVDGGR